MCVFVHMFLVLLGINQISYYLSLILCYLSFRARLAVLGWSRCHSNTLGFAGALEYIAARPRFGVAWALGVEGRRSSASLGRSERPLETRSDWLGRSKSLVKLAQPRWNSRISRSALLKLARAVDFPTDALLG